MAQIAASARLGPDVPIADDVAAEHRVVSDLLGRTYAAMAGGGAPR